jgi:hypothetical protein
MVSRIILIVVLGLLIDHLILLLTCRIVAGFLVSDNSASPVVNKSEVHGVGKRELMPHVLGVYL